MIAQAPSFTDQPLSRSSSPLAGLALPARGITSCVQEREGRSELSSNLSWDTSSPEARDLIVAALTPSGKTIVEYHLPSIPSGPLAQKIAAAMLSESPVQTKLKAIGDAIAHGDAHPIACIQALSERPTPHTLTRVVPTFAEYATNPSVIDTRFSGWIVSSDLITSVEITINPEIKAATVVAKTSTADTGCSLRTDAFRARPEESFWTVPHSDPEIVSELITVAWTVFDDLAALGSAPAARKWSQPLIDARLKDGGINRYLARHVPCLYSAARVVTEVGDHVACVKVEVVGQHGDEPSFTWVISSRPHLLDMQGKEISVLRNAAQSLRQGTREERITAIRALDEIGAKRSRAAPLERLLGAPLLKSLRGLPNVTVESTDPRAISDVLDLLEGIASFDVRYRDPGPNRLRPQDPDRLRFGITPDGGLHLELKTPLGNYLWGVIPAERFTTGDARNQIIKHFTSLFATRTERDLFRLRSLIEEAAAADRASSDDKPRETRSTLQLPSTAHDIQNRAYETAAEIAKLYQVAGTTVSLSSARVSFGAPESCEITLSSDNRNFPMTMKLHVVPTGVRAIELATKGAEGTEGAVIPLTPPLSPATDEALLRGIFQRFKTLSRTPPLSVVEGRPTLRSTPLYRFVHRLRPPDTLLGYVQSFLARNSSFHGLFS